MSRIRMVQLGVEHPHAEAYRGTLALLADRIEVVGFLARPDDPRTSIVGPFAQDPRRADSPWRQERFSTPAPGGYGHAALLAMRNFLDAIAGVAEPVYTVWEATDVLAVIETAYESARTGQVVRFDRTAQSTGVTE